MITLEIEREHLARADRDIAQGEARVAAQIELVERLRSIGHGPGAAEALLATMRQTLQAWRDHRDEILRIIERLERADRKPGAKRPQNP